MNFHGSSEKKKKNFAYKDGDFDQAPVHDAVPVEWGGIPAGQHAPEKGQSTSVALLLLHQSILKFYKCVDTMS